MEKDCRSRPNPGRGVLCISVAIPDVSELHAGACNLSALVDVRCVVHREFGISVGGDVLLYVNLQGNARVLWRNPGASGETLAHPSPDGRHLAIQTWVASGNMWIMEDF